VILFIVYQALATPFRAAMYGWTSSGGYGRPAADVIGALMWLVMTLLLFWLAYQYIPGVRKNRERLANIPARLRRAQTR